MASRLLRAVRKAFLASRTVVAAASHSAHAADAAASAAARSGSSTAIAPINNNNCNPTRGNVFTKPRQKNRIFYTSDFDHLPDDAKTPTDEDLESDEAVWAFYKRWCKAFNKERDHAEMARRFKLFRARAQYVHSWNTDLPDDPEEAAVYIDKRREAKLLLSKGQDVSQFEEWHLPMTLGPFADEEDHVLSEYSERVLKSLEERDALMSVVRHVAAAE